MGKKNEDVEYGPRVRLKGSALVPGKWTPSENRKYLNFLSENKQKLQACGIRLSYGIYKAMSNRIPGRTSDQCRGHHRRMIQTYKTIDEILVKLSQPHEIPFEEPWRLSVKVSKPKQSQQREKKPTINIMVTLNGDSICLW